jgi:hypothetical protein
VGMDYDYQRTRRAMTASSSSQDSAPDPPSCSCTPTTQSSLCSESPTPLRLFIRLRKIAALAESPDIPLIPSSTTLARQSQSRSVLSESKKDRRNKRWREQHAQERPYFREMVNAHSEQHQAQFPISTDGNVKVIGLKTKWHNSVRSIAKTILR